MKNLKPLILIVSLFSISLLSTTDARNRQENVDSQYYDDYDDEYDDPMVGGDPIKKNEKTIHLNTNQPPKESTTDVHVHDFVGIGKGIKQLRILLENLYPILRPLLILLAIGAGLFASYGAYMKIFAYLSLSLFNPNNPLQNVNLTITGKGCVDALVTIVVAILPPLCAGLFARYLTLTAKTDDKDIKSDSDTQ